MGWPARRLTLSSRFYVSPAVDQQRRTQVGHGDPRGDLQHADVAGGAGGREGEAGPRPRQPDGGPDHGGLSFCVQWIV